MRAGCEAAVNSGVRVPVGHPIYAAEHGGSAALSYGVGSEFEPRRCNVNRCYFDAGTSLASAIQAIRRGRESSLPPATFVQASVRYDGLTLIT